MNVYEIPHYSHCLERDMTMKVYGHYGVPVLVFPCQNSGPNNFEEFGMIDVLAPYIEAGRIKLYCVASIDPETISDVYGDKGHRAYMMNQYFYYIVNEVLPLLYEDCHGFQLPFVTGCSAGGTWSAVMFFRRPDLFAGVLGIAGLYDLPYFFGGWCDSALYESCPPEFIKNMPSDHPYINIYNSKKIILVGSDGAWDGECTGSLRYLDWAMKSKGIRAWVDIWGSDASHDWPWWKKMMEYHLPHLLD